MPRFCNMHNFMVLFRFVACMYVVMLGVFAIIDAYDWYTYPIYAWQAMILIELVAMIVGLFVSLTCMLKHADKFNFMLNNTPEDQVKFLKDKDARDAAKKQLSIDYMCSVSHRSVDFAFFSLMTLTAMWLTLQVMFIYNYTKDTDGYQAALDAGFPTESPLYYTVFFKLQLMFSLQIQMATAIGVCFVGYSIGKAAKHHSA